VFCSKPADLKWYIKRDVMPIQWEYDGNIIRNIIMIVLGYYGEIRGRLRGDYGILKYCAFQQQMYTHIISIQ